MPNEELKELLDRIQTSLSHKQTTNFWYEMSIGLIETSEKIVVHSPLGEKVKINGLSDALKSNEDFQDLVEMIELQYTSFSNISPELRIMYTILTTAVKLHSINSFLDKRQQMIMKQQEQSSDQPSDQPLETKSQDETKPELNTELNFDD